MTSQEAGVPPAAREARENVADTPEGLLLVEASTGSRAMLQRILTMQGFTVTSATGVRQARLAVARQAFAYAVVNLRLGDGHGLELVRQLRRGQATMRIVIATDADSFASVVAALRAGADDYVAQPATHAELLDALRGRSPLLPPVPDTPLGLSRICWEHVMRIYEQCDRNVTLTARRLRMHRRSLQRLLSKRSPLLRGAVDP